MSPSRIMLGATLGFVPAPNLGPAGGTVQGELSRRHRGKSILAECKQELHVHAVIRKMPGRTDHARSISTGSGERQDRRRIGPQT